jgi:Leucine-rich repeat (LRR) protein
LKKYLVYNYDYDDNGEISIAEAENITMVNCSGKGVADLTGLESCTNLVTLDCSNNNITKIELPNLAQLETVTCNDCPIELMNFNGCTSLQYLNLQDATTNAIIGNKLHINKYNQAKSLTIDVSNTTLEHIFVCRSEILAYLDVSKNTQLKHLEVYVNPNLKSIDVSTLVNLEILDLGDCDLTNLDVSKNLMLTELYVTNNKLSTIDVSKNKQLKVLKCKGNQISNLNVSNNDKLETLIVEDNKLSAINLRNNTALTYLNINNNVDISMIDVKYNTSLINLYCNGLAIEELNIVNNTALSKLECHSNPNLTTLICNDAFDFTTTHISINKGLDIISANGSVYIRNNDLEELTNGLFKFTNIRGSFDISGSKNLKTLKNGPIRVLGEFNISRCTSLDSLEYCPNNVAGDFTCLGTKFTKQDIKAACYHRWRQITQY